MEPYGWTMLNSVATFGPESFPSGDRKKWLYAWIVKDIQKVQAWLEKDSGWDGTLYDAEPIEASAFVQKAEQLFALPKKAILPDLSWVKRGWVAYEAEEKVSMMGEGDDQWIIIYYTLGNYVESQPNV